MLADSLGNLLVEDSESAKKIKSLYKREEEYAHILGPIEAGILSFYFENPKLTDSQVEKIIKNIRQNYSENTGFFKEPLEKAILKMSELAVKRKPISHHEYKLALSYILWSIDNRKWLSGKTAYLDWLAEFFGPEDEKNEQWIDFLNFEPTETQEELTKKESEEFAAQQSQRKDKTTGGTEEGPNLELQNILLAVVSNQLRMGRPKATKETFDRLMGKGHDKETAKKMIAATVAEEIFTMLKNGKEFDEKRFTEKLSKLG